MLKCYKFTDKEIAEVLNSAVVLIDTREKNTFQKDYLMNIVHHVY